MAEQLGGITTDKQKSQEVLDAWRQGRDAYADAVDRSELSKRYLNNDPYSDEDKTKAKKFKKPLLSLNIIQPTISVMVGNEQQARRRGRIKARAGSGQARIAGIVQGRWNMLNDELDIEESLQNVFVDGLSMRVGGWMERMFKVNEDGYLDFHYEIANGFRIKLDPDTLTSDYRLKKTRWLVKEAYEPLDVIIDTYGDRSDFHEEKKVTMFQKIQDYIKRISDDGYSNEADYDKENDRYRVLELQKRVGRKYVTFYDTATQEYGKVTAKDFKTLRKDNPSFQKIIETVEDKIYITTIIPYFGDLVVQDEYAKWEAPNYSVFPMFSFEHNVQVTEAACMADLLLDIQDDINKSKSQARDYITQILSGALAISDRDKDVIKQIKTKGNQPNQVWALKDMTKKPFRVAPENIPPDILMNQENSRSYIDEVTLINQALRGGMGKSGESGDLFAQKVERAAAAVNPYFANLSRLRKALLEDYVDNFSFVYSEFDRIVNVKDPETGEYRQEIINLNTAAGVLNDVNNLSMYVELDEGQDNVTFKEENFQQLLALVNIISTSNPELVDWVTLLKKAPVDGSDEMVLYAQQILGQQSQEKASSQFLAEQKAAVDQIAAERNLEQPQQPQQ